MKRPVDHDPIVEKLLVGTPARVLAGLSGNAPGVCEATN